MTERVVPSIELSFDGKVFDVTVLQKAAIKFTDISAFDFRVHDSGAIFVDISFPFAVEPDVQDFVARFRNEVLDQSLRAKIAAETESERNLILAYAFSNTKLVSE